MEPAGGSQGLRVIDVYALDKAVEQAILENKNGKLSSPDFSAQAHTILSTEFTGETENQNTSLDVYVMYLYAEFEIGTTQVSRIDSIHTPAVLRFESGKDGGYQLADYWTPPVGNSFISSIQERFPDEIIADALNEKKFLQAHMISCYEQALAYAALDVSEEIAGLLETISSTPALSSNPNEYINAHPEEYNLLIYYGERTLDYSFALFEQGGQRDLKAAIMARACQSILLSKGWELDEFLFATGQDWYDNLKLFQEG